MVHNSLCNRGFRPLGELLLVLKHCCKLVRNLNCNTLESFGAHTERKLLQGPAGSLRPEEPDHNCFGKDPAAVDQEIFPSDGLGALVGLVSAMFDWSEQGLTDRVDIGSEELSGLTPELEDGDATSSVCVGEDLDQICCLLLALSFDM